MDRNDAIGTSEGWSVERYNRRIKELYAPATRITGDRILRDGSWSPSLHLNRPRYLWRHTAKTIRTNDAATLFNSVGTRVGASSPYLFVVPAAGYIRRIACFDHQTYASTENAYRIQVKIRNATNTADVATVLDRNDATNKPPFDKKNLNQAISPINTHLIEVAAFDATTLAQIDGIFRVHFEFALNFGALGL